MKWLFGRRREREKRLRLMEAVNQCQLSVFGDIIEATRGDEEIRARAESAILRLLPKLEVHHISRLNRGQRDSLNRYLRLETPNPKLTLALLKALETMGGWHALEDVRMLASQQAATETQQRIVAAANLCLPSLSESARKNAQAMTLLHPSSPPQPPDESPELLRSSYPPCIPADATRPAPDKKI
jgi:hypothetical protein